MEMENRNTNHEENPLKVLWVLLSALGLLIIVGMAGFFFFSSNNQTTELKPVLAATTALPTEAPEEFDPIEWARQSDEYPEMVSEDGSDDSFIVELVTEDEAVAEKNAELVTPPTEIPQLEEAAEPVVTYKDVKVLVYWIQVGSYTTMTKAEGASSFLKDKGVSSTVQLKAVNGKTMYRVRIGAFNTKNEADKFNMQVRTLSGFEQSYVVQSTISRQVPVNS